MNWKDRISISVSIAALLISMTSSYFNFFYVETALGDAVLGVDLNKNDNTTTVSVAVLNTGNQQVALVGAALYLVQMDGVEELRQPMTAAKSLSEKSSFPVLVEPGKLVLFEMKANLPWETVVAYRQEVEPGDDHTHKTIMGVTVDALGATGVRLTGNNDAIRIMLRDTDYGGHGVSSEVRSLEPIQLRSQ